MGGQSLCFGKCRKAISLVRLGPSEPGSSTGAIKYRRDNVQPTHYLSMRTLPVIPQIAIKLNVETGSNLVASYVDRKPLM